MAKSQTNVRKAATSVFLVVAIIAGSINAAAAVCANVDPAATSAYCSTLSPVVPAGSNISPCNNDPGCGVVRQPSAVCVPLDSYCCAQPDCYAASTGGACKNGTTPACLASPGAPAPLTPSTINTVPVTPSTANSTVPITPATNTIPIAPSSAPTAAGGVVAGDAVVNTTSNTVLVCYRVPISAVVR